MLSPSPFLGKILLSPTRHLSLSGCPLQVAENSFSPQRTFQRSVDIYCYSLLLNSVPLRDQRLGFGVFMCQCLSQCLVAGHSFWTFGYDLVRSGVLFRFVRCSCGVVLDVFGDHIHCTWLQSWSYEVKICHHDTICDAICCKTIVDVRKKEQCCGIALVMFSPWFSVW